MHTYICACTCICVSLHLFTRKNVNAVSYVPMCMRLRACICVHAFACVRLHACLRADLIKTQNTFARKIFQHSKRTLGSETFRMYYRWLRQKIMRLITTVRLKMRFSVYPHVILLYAPNASIRARTSRRHRSTRRHKKQSSA